MKKKDFDYYFAQLRKIEDHREQKAEKEIRKLYKDMLKDTKQFVADEYYKLAENGELTYEILRAKQQDARFLAEVEQRLNGLSTRASNSIKKTVEAMYEISYNEMVKAVQQSSTTEELKNALKGIKGVSAETIKAHVNNPIAGLTLSDTLEKNRKNIIWDIKREIGVGLTNGDRYETMAKRIATCLDGDYKKAIRIVRTEAARAREAGHLEAGKNINDALQNGETEMRMFKTWKTMHDGAVREQHQPMNGITVAMDEYFILPDGTKTLAPKQSGVASQDINCRCFVKYELKADPNAISQVKKLENQEASMLSQKTDLQTELDSLNAEMKVLEADAIDGVWKGKTVTVKDYESLKASGSIDKKLQYFEEKYAATGNYDYISKRMKLEQFSENGEKYIKAKARANAINAEMKKLDDSIKDIRQKIMEAKGIDPKAMKEEIAELKKQLIASKNIKPDITSDIHNMIFPGEYHNYSSEDLINWLMVDDPKGIDAYKDAHIYLEEKIKELKAKDTSNMSYFSIASLQKRIKTAEDKLKGLEDIYGQVEKAKKLKDPAKIASLEKKIKDKQDELDAVIKRYGLKVEGKFTEETYTAERKAAAYKFASKKEADNIIRPHTGEVWKDAPYEERYAAYDYTHGSGKFNRPLRGQDEYRNIVGKDKIGLNNEGAESEIHALTSLIDKTEYDFDIWTVRGVGSSHGGSAFLQISEDVFDHATEQEMKDLLIGKVVKEDAFVSTGACNGTGFGGALKLNIYCPSGTKMIYCEPFSHYGYGTKSPNWDGVSGQSDFGYEFEMLLQRGTDFRITDIRGSGGSWVADVEVVDQNYD